MALAFKFDCMLREGIVTDYADLARLGLVTRARMTHIMNLLNLAPNIQEQIMFLPERTEGRETVAERDLRPQDRIVSLGEAAEAVAKPRKNLQSSCGGGGWWGGTYAPGGDHERAGWVAFCRSSRTRP